MTVPPLDAEIASGLRLRTLTPDDASLLVEATATEPGRAVWGPYPVGPYTPAEAREALQAWTGDQTSFALLDDTRLLAAFGLMREADDIAELAYWVPPPHRRHGYATRGLRFLAEWSLSAGGLRRVWLEIEPANTASRSVADGAGFRYERRIRDHCRNPETGAPHDCLIYAKP
ncbi:GNAT family N-acetyltransferase [Actinoplanes sichuanensis]|uniref:GNAT family N-acetyltransferase n=1 Tax=Actinoplanes sichuanensis TaxID=512349 RepID=A0ABW4A5S3_9ACTN|nr:GNAT family protein [Actinoplanes sichuanensis]BEL03128.1 GNAT family N-acetyltransferase [Actinoplanes sichuanensis]